MKATPVFIIRSILAFVTDTPSLRVSHAQPMHQEREFASSWPDHQVPVIRHDAVGQQPRRVSIERLPEHGFERGIVGSVMKDSSLVAASVQYVEDDAAASCERSFRHDVRVREQWECRVDLGRTPGVGS